MQQRHVNIHTDLCLCGSGKTIVACCFAIANTLPPGPPTGLSEPKCYAAILEDCAGGISREHFISQSIYETFTKGPLRLSGAPFLKGATKALPPSALAANVLCGRHNSALSTLDQLAFRLFNFILHPKQEPQALLVKGTDLERWFLKAMCGFVASGNAVSDHGKIVPAFAPPLDYLDVLFGKSPIPSGAGLYVVYGKPGGGKELNSIQFNALQTRQGEIYGISFRLGMTHFLFAARRLPELSSSSQAQLTYRPKVIMLDQLGVKREIHFGWPQGKELIFRERKGITETDPDGTTT